MINILEFGVGHSTFVMLNAIQKNKSERFEYARSELRRENPYRVYSLDNCNDWLAKVSARV